MGHNRRIDRFRRTPFLFLSGILVSSCGGGGGTGPSDRDNQTAGINQRPSVLIVAPSDGAVFHEAESVTFRGTATDTEDGTLTGGSLAWFSSLDGAIGTGTQFSTDVLSLTLGTHTITLTATDSDGAAAAAASISIEVNQGAISGRVFRLNDDAPLPGVRVTRSGPGGDTETVTNASGDYGFVDIPVGVHDVSVVSGDVAPFGSFVVSEQQVTIGGGLAAGKVDFAFQAAEVEIRTIADMSDVGVGTEVEITVELDLTEIPLPLSGVSGRIEWLTAVTGLVSGSATGGDVWNDTGGSFLTNESPPGTLQFAGVSPTTGIVDDVFTVMTFRVTTVAAGSSSFTPNLEELDVFDPNTGVSTPLLDIVILRTTTVTVTVQ